MSFSAEKCHQGEASCTALCDRPAVVPPSRVPTTVPGEPGRSLSLTNVVMTLT